MLSDFRQLNGATIESAGSVSATLKSKKMSFHAGILL